MILRFFGWKDWLATAICAAFVIIQVFLDLRIPEYMMVITQAIMDDESSSVIYGYGLEMIACALLSMGVSIMASISSVWAATSLCHTLRRKQFEMVGRFTPQDISRFSVDSLITRSTNDVNQVQQFITRAMQTLIRAPVITIWAVVKIIDYEWQWTAVMIIGVVILLLLMSYVILWTRPRFKRIPKLTDRINHYALEHLTGLRVVRAYNAERFQEKEFSDASNELTDNSISIWTRASLLPSMTNGITNLMNMLIYIVGIVLITATDSPDHQALLFSEMIVFSSYATQILIAFVRLAMMIQFSSRALESSRRIQELVGYEPCIKDGDFDGEQPEPGVIEFDHVDFTYPGTDVPVLKDLSFRIEQGQTVAIMGTTGSGKSTIIDLIMRFYTATSGSVKVGGIDVKDYKRHALSSAISYIPQNSKVFTGTIESNVNFGSTSSVRSYEDIRRAESMAQAVGFIDDMEGQEGFYVTEEGKNLSGGQRQRLTIARGICKDAPIWLLDDPFSALDFKTDKDLRTAIEKEHKGQTKLLVAQRVGTVMNSDLIIMLDEGRIIGSGKHADLMRTCPLYRELAVSQMTEGTY